MASTQKNAGIAGRRELGTFAAPKGGGAKDNRFVSVIRGSEFERYNTATGWLGCSRRLFRRYFIGFVTEYWLVLKPEAMEWAYHAAPSTLRGAQ